MSALGLISKRIAQLGDWRGKTLATMRKLIKQADPDVVEEWKWDLKDPARLFNSSMEGKVRRAIDIPEGAKIDEKAFKALIREAVALNKSGR